MAINDRNEAIAEVNAAIVDSPKVSTATHRDLLNDEILSSVQFRKDVTGIETPSGGNVVVSFLTKDFATITTSSNISISVTDLPDGDIKYIALTKNAGNTVSFSGITDVSARRDYVDTEATYIVYRITSKNSNIYAVTVNIDNDENIAGLTGDVSKVVTTYSGWNMDTTLSVLVSWPSGVTFANFLSAEVTIKSNAGTGKYPLLSGFGGSGFLSGLGGSYVAELSGLTLYRGDVGGFFDDAQFNNADVEIFIKYNN